MTRKYAMQCHGSYRERNCREYEMRDKLRKMQLKPAVPNHHGKFLGKCTSEIICAFKKTQLAYVRINRVGQPDFSPCSKIARRRLSIVGLNDFCAGVLHCSLLTLIMEVLIMELIVPTLNSDILPPSQQCSRHVCWLDVSFFTVRTSILTGNGTGHVNSHVICSSRAIIYKGTTYQLIKSDCQI